jgi:glycosyltransferase involved in cell wall biosynthesis
MKKNIVKNLKIAVVIPCYKVAKSLGPILNSIDGDIDFIYCIDDACPEKSYKIAEKYSVSDHRIRVIRHKYNLGVGGAVITGYKSALKDGVDIVIKIDGDGQMDVSKINKLIRPLLEGESDYVKGNRFYNVESLSKMPVVRLFGNIILSFLSKISTGYWDLFDPTNGFTAVHSKVLKIIPLDKLNKRYFFETDFLFRLNTIQAVVKDIPLDAIYGDEESSMKIHTIILSFPFLHIKTIVKRVFYNYFLRNFSIASINLILGSIFILYGFLYGLFHWYDNIGLDDPTPAGIVMMAALPIIVGMQLFLNFVAYDMASRPTDPIHLKL